MPATKFLSASAIAALVPDGATLAITGAGGGLLEPDAVLAAIEARFLATGHPRGLTVVHAQGLGDGKGGGLGHLAHEGLVVRVIGAHWSWSPAMQALAAQETIEAFALPGGVIQHLIRETGAGRPGLITHVGLDSFVDPAREGGAMNARAAVASPLVEAIDIGGMRYLRYLPLPIDVAILRGSRADAHGNVDFGQEGAELDAVVLAMAARTRGGRVLVQVREEVAVGSRPGASVRLPGAWVDAVLLVPGQRWSHAGDEAQVPVPAAPALSLERRIIAMRAAAQVPDGAVASLGFGMPDGVATVAREQGRLAAWHTTMDHGHHGGEAFHGALFGFVHAGEARVDSPTQFDFYSGGGIDVAVLGFGECDGEGNVNVSRLGGKVVGPGGFIDIAQNARTVIFCGTFEAKGLAVAIEEGQLRIVRPGSVAKFVEQVDQVTFSARQARSKGQAVFYVTERAVFRLTDAGLELCEVAPGIDPDRDIVARMGFVPSVADRLATMDILPIAIK